jgi:hypothetical protein
MDDVVVMMMNDHDVAMHGVANDHVDGFGRSGAGGQSGDASGRDDQVTNGHGAIPCLLEVSSL